MKSSGTLILLMLLLTGFSNALSPTGSVQVTTPQRLSLSLGVCGTDFFGTFGGSSGILFRMEPGISGGKLHLGMRSMFSLMFLPVVSADMTAALLQTWNDPWGVTGGQTYAGGEFRLGLRYLVFTAGGYRHVAGDREDKWLYSFGAGVGL